MSHISKLMLGVLLLSLMGCARAAYYRVEVDGGEYTYWRERHPTTFHGLCANLYGGGNEWEVDHPTGSGPDPSGSGERVSTHTDTRIFKTKAEGAAWAESVCPTK